MKRIVRSMFLVINLKTLALVILALGSTWACIEYGYIANLPMTLIGVAVVFPIVFSIGGAYTRREKALRDYANLKAHCRSLYMASRDWLPERNPEFEKQLNDNIVALFSSVRDFFATKQSKNELSMEKEKEVYRKFSNLSKFMQGMRDRGIPSGEMSRMNQYISKMLDAYEGSKHIYQYRTPITLRAYSRFFTFAVPVLYGPYFAHLGKDIEMWLAFITPLLFSLVLAGLDNIQDHLENPFDQIGEDDIKINAEKVGELLKLE